MAKEPSIGSLHEFISWVELSKVNLEKTAQEPLAFFYRGHSDRKYSLEPSAYRIDKNANTFRAVEYHLYQEMLRREPAAFSQDKSIFERLVRMQHHGLPTRLLDLTKNALVALFFVCESNYKKDGQVMLFHHPLSQVLFPSNIPGPSLSGLETRVDLPGLINIIMTSFLKFLENRLKLLEKTSYGCNKFREQFRDFLKARLDEISIKEDQSIEQKIYAFRHIEEILIPNFYTKWRNEFADCNKKLCYDEVKVLENTNILLQFITDLNEQRRETLELACENLEFSPSQKYNSYSQFIFQFFSLYFVQPPNNNERMRRQYGAFFLHPPLKGKNAVLEDFYTPVTVRIKRKIKESIKNQLSHIGITRAYLFPDLEEQAKDIRVCYPPHPVDNIMY